MLKRMMLFTAPVAFAICLSTLTPNAMGAARVYWANYTASGPISYANLDGSGGTNLTLSGTTINDPAGLTIDSNTGKLYWTNANINTISYSDIDGANGGTLNTNGASINYPGGISIYNGKAYFSNSNTNTISYANLDGSGGGNLNTGAATVNSPEGTVVYPEQSRIYWANNGTNKISYANLDGSGGADLNTGAATVDLPGSVAINPTANRIYWGNWATSRAISYANLDGSGGADLSVSSPAVEFAIGFAIDIEADRLYWANYGFSDIANTISSARLDGSDGRNLATAGATTNLNVYPLLVKPPTNTEAPTVSGESTVGATLSCSTGAWKQDVIEASLFRAPRSFVYQWSRDGIDIPQETQSSLVVDRAGSYSCRVEASNAAGSTSQSSASSVVVSAPVITKLKVSPRKPKRPVRQVTFSMNLSQDAKVSLVVQRKFGRKVRGRCRSTSSKNRKGKRCLLYKKAAQSSKKVKAGRVRITLKTKSLRPGLFRAKLTATNSNGNSKPAQVLFYQAQ